MMYTNYPTANMNAMNSAAGTTFSVNRVNDYVHASMRLEHEIATSYVGLDTSSLMLYIPGDRQATEEQAMELLGKCLIRQKKVFDELEKLCAKFRKPIWVSEAVICELQHHMAHAIPRKAEMAAKADMFLQHMHQLGLLNIIPLMGTQRTMYGAPCCDHEILLILENLRAKATTPLTLLCQDGRLAADSLKKNETSCVSGQPIRVYRFNMGGELCEFAFNQEGGMQRPSVQQGWQAHATTAQNAMGGYTPFRPTATPVSGGFGASRPAVQPVSSGFGASRPAVQPVSGSFGASRPAVQPVSGGFGASRPAVQPVSGGYAGAPADQQRNQAAAPRNQAGRQQTYSLASTEVSAPTTMSYAPRDIATAGCPVPTEGAKVLTIDGKAYTLGAKFSAGGEATLYRVVEDDKLLVKIYHKAACEAQAYKIATLAAIGTIPGAVLPIDLVYTEADRFAGYTMPLIEDAVSLATTFDKAWRDEQQANSLFVSSFGWDREEYVRAAVNLVRIAAELYNNGVIITDASLQNVLVGKDADGKYSANHLMLIDVDSCQVETTEGVVAGGGVTEDFCPGEIASQLPFSTDMLLSESTLVANLALQTFTTIMVGVHPYARAENDAGFVRAAARGEFPYSLTGKRSQFDTLDKGHTYLFSHLPTKLKELYFNLLHGSGDMFRGDRISLADLQRELGYYLRWLGDPATSSRFPEVKSLSPSSTKPFVHTCSCPTCTTGMPNEAYRVVSRPEELTKGTVLKLSKDEYMCPTCYEHMMEQRKRAQKASLQSASRTAQGGWQGSAAICWP